MIDLVQRANHWADDNTIKQHFVRNTSVLQPIQQITTVHVFPVICLFKDSSRKLNKGLCAVEHLTEENHQYY